MEQKSQKYYIFVLYLVIVVVINIVGLNFFARVDLTANNLYSLSDASIHAVSSLKEPLTIKVFFTTNLPAPHNNTELYLHDLLESFELNSRNRLNYRFYDVSAKEGDISEKAEGNRKLAQDYGIYPVNVQLIERDEAKVQRAYMGMVFIHGNVIEKIPAVTSTNGLEYKITSTIQKMNNKISALINLPRKIRVNLIQSSSLFQIANAVKLQGLEDLREQVAGVVSELQSKTYNQLEFNYIDPSTSEEVEKTVSRFEKYGLQWPEFKSTNGLTISAGKGILAMGIEYGDKSVEKSLLKKDIKLTSRGLEEQFQVIDLKSIKTFIDENIDNLIDINEDIGYLSSHGTLNLAPNLPPQMQMMQPQMEALNVFQKMMETSYTVKEVNIKDDEIPDDVDTLIIAGAKESFSDWELFQIDQFLMKGKSLALFVNSFNEIQQQNRRGFGGMNQPYYLPINSGLEKLLGHYGVDVKKSYVMDESCYINRDTQAGEMPYYFVPIIKNQNINKQIGFMKNIKELISIKISPLEINEDTVKKNELTARTLFSSSKDSWEMKGRINLMPMFIQKPEKSDEMRSMPLAVLLEGSFPSYFADKPVPEKPKKEEKESEEGTEKKKEEQTVIKSEISGQQGVIKKGKPGRIFVMGTAEMLKDNIIDERVSPLNSTFVMNTLDYLNNRQDIAILRAKNQRFNPLKDSKWITNFIIKLINIGGLPLGIIIFGMIVWMRRKSRRKMIQNMFKKA